MRLFSNSNGVQVPYAPIFDGRLLLGMSLFSKKYSIYPRQQDPHNTRLQFSWQHGPDPFATGIQFFEDPIQMHI